MDKLEPNDKTTNQKTFDEPEEASTAKNSIKLRGTKRKRKESESSSDGDGILPENMLETEKNLHASAVKNNLDEISVRKILKKVVTNDHVLALVKLREEEENGLCIDEQNLPAKLTRSRAKELMKVSPNTAPWNLELTPIKHIPVKTRPEVKALIAQELPEDEDDDEYQPTHDDVPSDDDHTLESCSDLESQPRTPATPKSQLETSPKVVKDGPFKVPQSVSATKRKIDLEEEATIARRTRSKLSLSSTSIEHIESEFVPPDELPTPAVDDLWNQFLSECLDPAAVSRHEEDDDADPEYNVAADADALDEDEEALGNSIIKISKKELNDLVTELFNIMPEVTVDDGLAENLANSVLTDTSQADVTHWEGKQESPDEVVSDKISKRLTFEKRDTFTRVSIGKSEMEHSANEQVDLNVSKTEDTSHNVDRNAGLSVKNKTIHYTNKIEAGIPTETLKIVEDLMLDSTSSQINIINVEEGARAAPRVLRALRPARAHLSRQDVAPHFQLLPEQILILQQQFRQHIQFATFNFLELFVHPIHWNMAPVFKEYVQILSKIVEANPNSVVNVCNLKPAVELMTSWEKTVSEETPENKAMIKFMDDESEKCRRRMVHNNGYEGGKFHEILMAAVSHSSVFLYPHLLPPAPYRPDFTKKTGYLTSEDELIALGLDQFWRHVESNRQVYKVRRRSKMVTRMGMGLVAQLVSRHMLPWLAPHALLTHVGNMRRLAGAHNPISKYLRDMKSPPPLVHKLLPYNPKLTLYEQPASEMPKVWLRYLAKSSNRIKEYLHRSAHDVGVPPQGVPVVFGQPLEVPQKQPLPIHFNQEIVGNQPNTATPTVADKFDVCFKPTEANTAITTPTADNMLVATNIFTVVQTSTGSVLVPLVIQSNTDDSKPTPVSTPQVIATNQPERSTQKVVEEINETQNVEILSRKKSEVRNYIVIERHCECCKLLRKIKSRTQKLITDYFRKNKSGDKSCFCTDMRYPRISNRLKLFMSGYQSQREMTLHDIEIKMKEIEGDIAAEKEIPCSIEDVVYVASFNTRLTKYTQKAKAQQRKHILSLFSKLDMDCDVTKLMDELYKLWYKDYNELYQDFFGLLTAVQADKIGAFKYYFSSRVKDFIAKIDEEIKSKETRNAIIKEIKSILYGQNDYTSCQICRRLLALMKEYPRLAEYTFSCFPHRKDSSCRRGLESASTLQEQNVHAPVPDKPRLKDTNNATMNHVQLITSAVDVNNENAELNIQTEPAIKKQHNPILNADDCIKVESHPGDAIHQLITTIKHEPDTQEYPSCDSPTSLVILEDDIKSEFLEWTRDEDKIILKRLQECLTPEQRKDKTIIDMINDKSVYDNIAQSLNHKTVEEIKNRFIYLLELLLLSED